MEQEQEQEQEQDPENRSVPERPAKLEDMEQLFVLWQDLQGREERPEASVRLRNPEEVAAYLAALRIGPVPDGLHEEVQQVWSSYQWRWASRSDSVALRQELQELAASPGRCLRDLQGLEDELAARRERLATLHLLCEVLDELLVSQGDVSFDGGPAEPARGPGDETQKGKI